MYKDPDKQREANRQAQARFKAKVKGITKQDMKGITGRVLPEDVPAHGLTAGFENTVDVITESVAGRVKAIRKRGKAIKVFDDLPVDVRLIINRLSDSKEEKQRRTAGAINYQHQFSP